MNKLKVSLITLALILPMFAVGQNKAALRSENICLKAELERLRHRVDSLESGNKSLQSSLDSLRVNLGQDSAAEMDFEFDTMLGDSLLANWLVQRQYITITEEDMDSVRFSSDVPDEVFMKRLEDIHSFIPLPFNDVVKNYCILYSEKMRTQMGQLLGLAEYYWPLFDEVLSFYGLPLELKYLVIVESKLNPRATSRVGAKGLWQFMYTTGKGYGLRIDSWMDERMDPLKSSVAAARYLRDAYKLFGDWTLAIASYNCGAGNVNKAIKRSGGKRDFWQIYEYLPRETRSYVPAFVGAMYAANYYKEYAITPVKSALVVPVDTMLIHKDLHFEQISAVTGVDVQMISDLNPQYVHNIVPASKHECVLRLPMSASAAFISAGDSLYTYQKDKYFNPVELKKIEESSAYGPPGSKRIVYKVKSGDVLGKIAQRHGVSVAQLKKWNNLKSTNIRIGQKLVIYKK